MTTHQQKKLALEELQTFRDRFGLPLSDQSLQRLDFYRPPANSAEFDYLHERRKALGGELPRRRRRSSHSFPAPSQSAFARFALEADGKSMSTTMAAVRMLGQLLKDEAIGPRIVPIVADEARTFGMANLFRQVGIYSPSGQLYEPEDLGSMLYYREELTGQILEEGISEAGAISSWVAAATSYSVSDQPMLPFYIYYSMFGWQRVGDLIWAAADQRARGFLLGATAGRTTLSGEGLQHQDGSSHLGFASVPNCRAYDPSFAYEIAVIFEHGIDAMLNRQDDCFYYLTVGNENADQPSMPEGVAVGIVRGLYRLPRATTAGSEVRQADLQLLASGAMMSQALQAAERLDEDFGLYADVWSATSYSELQRDGIRAERQRRIDPSSAATAYVSTQLADCTGPVIAISDYVRAYPELIRPFISQRYITLGTDGFGRSATRPALRAFFEVDAMEIVLTALAALVDEGRFNAAELRQARIDYGRDLVAGPAPWES